MTRLQGLDPLVCEAYVETDHPRDHHPPRHPPAEPCGHQLKAPVAVGRGSLGPLPAALLSAGVGYSMPQLSSPLASSLSIWMRETWIWMRAPSIAGSRRRGRGGQPRRGPDAGLALLCGWRGHQSDWQGRPSWQLRHLLFPALLKLLLLLLLLNPALLHLELLTLRGVWLAVRTEVRKAATRRKLERLTFLRAHAHQGQCRPGAAAWVGPAAQQLQCRLLALLAAESHLAHWRSGRPPLTRTPTTPYT